MKASIHARYVHITDGDVRVRQYADETLALTAESVDEDGFPEKETLSVNLTDYHLNPGEGHVFVKDYAEHEGLPDALEEAGLGRIVERIAFGPFGTEAALFALSDQLTEEADR